MGLKLGALRSLAGDHEPPGGQVRQQCGDPEQTIEVLLRAQAGERAEQALVWPPAQAERLARLAGQRRGVDPVRDVAHPMWIQPPDLGDGSAQALRGHHDRGLAGQSEPAQPDTARQLRQGFLRAEAVDHVQVRTDRADAVGQRPFDRTPVVGQQEIGPLVAQNAAEGLQIGQAQAAAPPRDHRA